MLPEKIQNTYKQTDIKHDKANDGLKLRKTDKKRNKKQKLESKAGIPRTNT